MSLNFIVVHSGGLRPSSSWERELLEEEVEMSGDCFDGGLPFFLWTIFCCRMRSLSSK